MSENPYLSPTEVNGPPAAQATKPLSLLGVPWWEWGLRTAILAAIALWLATMRGYVRLPQWIVGQ